MAGGLPYTLELLALRRPPAATFAVLMSLAPAIGALAVGLPRGGAGRRRAAVFPCGGGWHVNSEILIK
ncbi:hypothetical protein GCM10010430_75050 [Kitasatospora cystarginea]|uniref:Uncharacterized protein n=1 Tax=Kitasatospora cystarginea TaxID=58350 RepID=A0ABN3EYX1_9ACTN